MDYICTSIEKVFVKGGFKRVITPALEFYDVFSIPSSGISQESMFKTFSDECCLFPPQAETKISTKSIYIQ
jgi:ATP phosphoribosyltransferase regulatory subunit HisZ